MNRDIRAMSIAYKLLARMDRRAQVAAVEWLKARLDSDATTASEQERISAVACLRQLKQIIETFERAKTRGSA